MHGIPHPSSFLAGYVNIFLRQHLNLFYGDDKVILAGGSYLFLLVIYTILGDVDIPRCAAFFIYIDCQWRLSWCKGVRSNAARPAFIMSGSNVNLPRTSNGSPSAPRGVITPAQRTHAESPPPSVREEKYISSGTEIHQIDLEDVTDVPDCDEDWIKVRSSKKHR